MSIVFSTHFSKEDGEYVATCDRFPSLSHLDVDPYEALNGLKDLVIDVLLDMQDEYAISHAILEKVRKALGLTEDNIELHAYYNLLGVLIDIKHEGADEVCIETIDRVMGQLAEVGKLLEGWGH